MRQSEGIVAPILGDTRRIARLARDFFGLVESAEQGEGERHAMERPAFTNDIRGLASVHKGVLPSLERLYHMEVIDVSLRKGKARVGTEPIVPELSPDLERLLPSLPCLLGPPPVAVRLGHDGKYESPQGRLLLAQGEYDIFKWLEIRDAPERHRGQGELGARPFHQYLRQALHVARLTIGVDGLLVVVQTRSDVLVVVVRQARTEVKVSPLSRFEIPRGLCGGQGGLVVVRGLAPREDTERLIGRTPSEGHHHVRRRDGAGLDEMVCNLHQVLVEALRVHRLQAVSDLLVVAKAPRWAGPVIEHVADQRMGELEGGPVAPQQPLSHALLEQIQQLVLTHTADGAQGLERESVAEEGGQGEGAPAGLA